jgi:hypothetical protein
MTARSIVRLPADVGREFEVYVNGVRQEPDSDFHLNHDVLVFDRALSRDCISRWRWFLGAWGVGTYRQDDTVDVRYEAEGRAQVAHALPIVAIDGD